MIDFIHVANRNAEILELPIKGAKNTGLIITNVEGIGPPQADIQLRQHTSMHGSKYQNAFIKSRNIVLTMLYEDVYDNDGRITTDIEHARLLSYKFFGTSNQIRIRIKTNERDVYTDGYVESYEPVIFSNRTGCTVSIICPDPMFYDFNNGGIKEKFFSNVQQVCQVYYEGSYPVGFEINIKFKTAINSLIIETPETGKRLALQSTSSGSSFYVNDKLKISSEVGNKYVLYNAVALPAYWKNILGSIRINSTWPILYPGYNEFQFSGDQVVDPVLYAEVTFKYKEAFEGV